MNRLIWLLLPLLCACSGDEEELRQWVRENSKHSQAKVPALPPAKPYEAMPYDSQGLPDPFSESKIEPSGRLLAAGGNGKQPDFLAREQRNSPLEKVPLESLRMIGFLRINHQPIAVIRSEQMIRQVKVGEYLGLDFGVVTQITEQELTLRELIQDSNGNWTEKTSTLRLIEQEGTK